MEEKDVESEINKALGFRILAFRKSKNMSRRELSNILSITQQQLEKYEKGINRISASKLFLIARKFNVSFSYFFENMSLTMLKKDKEFQKNIEEVILSLINIKEKKDLELVLSIIKRLK